MSNIFATIAALHGQRIAVIGDFDHLKDGTEGTAYDPLSLVLESNYENFDAIEALNGAEPTEFAIRYDGHENEWWYATPDEEGETWRRI